jgi:outer membrane protein assembly factor BamB
MDSFDHNTNDDTFSIEITDLDARHSGQRATSQGMRHWSPFWRVVILGVTLFLTLIIILESLPSVRAYLWQVLVPVSPGNIVIGASSGTVAAVQSGNGRLLWHVQVSGSILSAPTVSTGMAYIGTNTGDLYALRVTDGALLWHFSTRGLVSSWQIRDGIIYVPSADPDALYALRASTGDLLWHTPTNGPLSPSLVILNGMIYGVTASLFSTDQQSASIISAWHAQDGVLLWQRQIPPSPSDQIVGAGGSVYVSAADGINAQTGHLYALRASDGTVLWQKQTGAIASSPVLANGTIYVASFDGISALRTRDGALLWNFQPGPSPFVALAVDAGGVDIVIPNFASRTSSLSRLQGNTGSLLWQEQEGTPILALEEMKGSIYLAAEDGTLSALRASDGTHLWSRRFEGTTFQEITSNAPSFLVEGGNGILVIHSQDSFGTLYALRERDGTPLWNARISSSPKAGEAEP